MGITVVVVAGSKRDQTIRLRHRQRPQQHRVNQTEDSAVGADPQRQRDDGNQREAGLLHQHSRAVAQV